jgi:membrane associated rhomboid family serine protease
VHYSAEEDHKVEAATCTMQQQVEELESLRARVRQQEVLIRELLAAQEQEPQSQPRAQQQAAPSSTVLNEDDFPDESDTDRLLSSSPKGYYEESDAALARMMQSMEMGVAEEEERQGSGGMHIEDPVWGPLETEGEPRPHQVLCFAFCPCLTGKLFEWGQPLSCLGSSWRLPVCESRKSKILGELVRTWALLIAVVQVIALLVSLVLNGGGIAPGEVNPMIGPWPSALVAMGAKVSALVVYEHQMWRLFTPMLLHAGFIHLGVNLAIQLRMGLMLEKLWGSRAWITIYVVSGLFSALASCIFLPDQIGVGSSGAIMGLMGAWFVHIICSWSSGGPQGMLNIVLVFINVSVTLGFSFVPFIDWAAHIGGLIAGALTALILFGTDGKQRSAGAVFLAIAFAAAILAVATSHPDPAMVNMCDLLAAIQDPGC